MTLNDRLDKPEKKKYKIIKEKNKFIITINGNRVFNSKSKESCINFYRTLTNFPFRNDFEFNYEEFANL